MTAAIQYKVLGQLDLGAASATTVYTVPNTAGNYAVVSSIVVANRVATPNTFRLWVAVASAGDDVKQYIAYDLPIAGNDSVPFKYGLTLGPNDLVRAYAANASLSVSVYGEEFS